MKVCKIIVDGVEDYVLVSADDHHMLISCLVNDTPAIITSYPFTYEWKRSDAVQGQVITTLSNESSGIAIRIRGGGLSGLIDIVDIKD